MNFRTSITRTHMPRRDRARTHAGVPAFRARALPGLLLLLLACHAPAPTPVRPAAGPIDALATAETRALFANLQRLRRDHDMFGHQDDLAYGAFWTEQPGRSDVKETAGAYPAVYGWELGRLELDSARNLDGVDFRKQQEWIKEGYRRGGVITVSWHMSNPVTGGTAWDHTPAVGAILPGGAQHEKFVGWLDRFARWDEGLVDDRGRPIPIVFRPYHETSGSWFWWGGRNRAPEQYQQLWRFTVEYLRDRKGLHNILYSYSTDVFDSAADYLKQYPGDRWVDVLGYDDYHAVAHPGDPALPRRLRELVQMADERAKIPALTETGLAGVPDPNWWTGTLLAGIKADTIGRHIAWVLVWRSGPDNDPSPDKKWYVPYPGQASAADFVRFRNDPLIVFEDRLPGMYLSPGAGTR